MPCARCSRPAFPTSPGPWKATCTRWCASNGPVAVPFGGPFQRPAPAVANEIRIPIPPGSEGRVVCVGVPDGRGWLGHLQRRHQHRRRRRQRPADHGPHVRRRVVAEGNQRPRRRLLFEPADAGSPDRRQRTADGLLRVPAPAVSGVLEHRLLERGRQLLIRRGCNRCDPVLGHGQVQAGHQRSGRTRLDLASSSPEAAHSTSTRPPCRSARARSRTAGCSGSTSVLTRCSPRWRRAPPSTERSSGGGIKFFNLPSGVPSGIPIYAVSLQFTPPGPFGGSFVSATAPEYFLTP